MQLRMREAGARLESGRKKPFADVTPEIKLH